MQNTMSKPSAPKLPSGMSLSDLTAIMANTPNRAPLAPMAAPTAPAPTLPPMPNMAVPKGTPGFFDALKNLPAPPRQTPRQTPNPTGDFTNTSGGGIMNQGLTDREIANRQAREDYFRDSDMGGGIAPSGRAYDARMAIGDRYRQAQNNPAGILPPSRLPPKY
jgi:hypothetical protein